jgi:cytochrome c oxidase cbb3-type subunit I/II
MRNLGVPYPDNYEAQANADLEKQADEIVQSLKQDKITISSDREIIALIAYLQRLGTDIKNEK